MSERNDYIIYDQLAYLWKKKWILLLIPVLAAVIAYALTSFSSNGYEGKAVVFTGTDKDAYLTEPDILDKQYAKNIKDVKAEFDVMEKSRVKLEVKGDDKEAVASTVNSISSDLMKRLDYKYNFKKDLTLSDNANDKQTLVQQEKALEQLEKDVASGIADPYKGEETPIAFVIHDKQVLIRDLKKSISNRNYDLEIFKGEKPIVLEQSTGEAPKAIKANTVIAFVLSFILTLFALLVWKYISEARRVRHG